MGGGCLAAAAWKLMLFHRSLQKRWKPLGASCGPLPPTPEGDKGGLCRGGDSPLGKYGSRVDLCQDPDPPPFWNTGASVSQSPSRQCWAWQSLATPNFEQFFRGFFGNKYIYVFFFESCWWLWLSLQSRWQQIDKRRGRAHPQCWWAWQPSEMGHVRHSCNNWPAEAKRRFRIITASFWYQLMFSSRNKPMTIADRWRLEIQKSPSTS